MPKAQRSKPKAPRDGERFCRHCRRNLDELLAEVIFWWAWGPNKWDKAPRAEKNDYRRSARSFLRSGRGRS